MPLVFQISLIDPGPWHTHTHTPPRHTHTRAPSPPPPRPVLFQVCVLEAPGPLTQINQASLADAKPGAIY